jgi:hypothetical protein
VEVVYLPTLVALYRAPTLYGALVEGSKAKSLFLIVGGLSFVFKFVEMIYD